MGQTEDKLESSSFDIVYSISVIEHVPSTEIQTVFADMHRVLKPGGRMFHMIDTYLCAPEADNSEAAERFGLYRSAFDIGFKPANLDEVISEDQVSFHPSHATNPDLIMNHWNKMAPSLRPLRSIAQGCSFIMDARRI